MHILWIKTEFLHPLDKGGRIRTYQMLRQLQASHRVTYVTLDDGSASEHAATLAREYASRVVRIPFRTAPKGSLAFYADLARNLFSPLPYAVAKYRSDPLSNAIRDLVRQEQVDVIVCDFLAPSLNVPSALGVPTILFQHNVEAAIWERHHRVARGFLRRLYMGEQWKRMRAHERRECLRFDRVVAVSDDDCNEIRRQYGVDSIPVPTGVDTDFFRPTGSVARVPTEIVFTGSMDWMPNEDGLTWFCEEILPRVQSEVPEASLTVVGRSPSKGVQALARRHARVTVTGSVPDVRPYMERGAVFVVPLRVGGGTRLKIFEAMAMEIPVVSTTIGAEGLPIRDGADFLLADSAEQFGVATLRLMRDQALARLLAAQAAARVRSEFGWREAAGRFAAICEEVRGAMHSGRAASPAGSSDVQHGTRDWAAHSPSA